MTAHPGSFCSPVGNTDTTTLGTPMVCAVRSGNRARWGSDALPDPRRDLLKAARALGLKVKRGTPNTEIQRMVATAQAVPAPAPTPVAAPAAPAEPASLTPQAAADALRAAYTPGEHARLARLARAAGLTPAQTQAAVQEILRTERDRVNVWQNAHGGDTTDDDRTYAVIVGNQAKHLISWDPQP
jgi:hypothetical protein